MTFNSDSKIKKAKVVWIGLGTVQEILCDTTFALAQRYVNRNRNNPQYAQGVLKTVSNNLRPENILHAHAAGNLKR
jgi:ABC-type transporter Mla subunit MlaD